MVSPLADAVTTKPSRFQRLVLPGFAFKAVVIGGGYATGRELAEYFMPSGPWGGLAGMLLATAIWSVLCVTTFLFARSTASQDYRTFFANLLGPFAVLFELLYFLFVVFILAVFGAAAGAIGAALFDWPKLYGTLCLMAGIVYCTTFGNLSVERLFKGVSILLYVTYALFMILALTKFGGKIMSSFMAAHAPHQWAAGGITYAAYNVIGAIVILPVTRHMQSSRDALLAGLLAGPLAMLPALAFFVCMCAFYPQIADQPLPSDYMLQQMGLPVFHIAFQVMIFAALLESGTGSVHAINERIARAYRGTGTLRELPNSARLAIAALVLIVSIFIADRFGLVTLIAKGYRMLALATLVLYVSPLMTYGVWRLWKGRALKLAKTKPSPSLLEIP